MRTRRVAPGPAAPPRDVLRELVRCARSARRNAHAPYSKFAVGSALRTRAGEIVTGCNIENATFGLTVCAERVAVWKAISEGLGPFTDVVVVADSPRPTPPCGPCRQILWEFCGDLNVHLAGSSSARVTTYRLSDLLPLPFDGRNLG